jgi:subtilisin family serine protease
MLALGGTAAASSRFRHTADGPVRVVGYSSESALRQAVAQSGSRLVRRIRALHVAVLESPPAARILDGLRGINYSDRPVFRRELVDPAVAPAPVPGGAYEWQYAAARENLVPAGALRAASAITIAVIDTGADVSSPDLAAKAPATWSVRTGSTDVTDYYGHGTFVSSLAVGSTTNAEGLAGFGGDAKLLAVQAAAPDGTISDVDESAAIVYAVDHGAKIINMSFGGPSSSPTEQAAIAYATAHGVLLVAAAGNSGESGNQPCCSPWARRARAELASPSRPPASPGLGRRFRTTARTSPWRLRARTFSVRFRRAPTRATGRAKAFRAPPWASTGTAAGRPSPRPRSQAPQHSSGP